MPPHSNSRRRYPSPNLNPNPNPHPHPKPNPNPNPNQVSVWTLSRSAFELKLGSLSHLASEQYLTDPRRLISDFYRRGDSKGPAGSLTAEGSGSGTSSWFAVYRPCSRDSISKMLGQVGVGKGLNIKGKSAKKNKLSGFVPFCQISRNEHKVNPNPNPNPDPNPSPSPNPNPNQGRTGERAERRAHAHLLPGYG